MSTSLAQLFAKKLTGEKMSDSKRADVHAELRTMRQTFKLPEPTYFAIVFRAYAQDAMKTPEGKAQDDKWAKVETLIKEKNP